MSEFCIIMTLLKKKKQLMTEDRKLTLMFELILRKDSYFQGNMF